MRTTIDLPDELFRKAKAMAALRGISLKQLFAATLAQALGASPPGSSSKRNRGEPPVLIPGKNRQIPTLTNAQLFEILDRIDEQIEKRSA